LSRASLRAAVTTVAAVLVATLASPALAHNGIGAAFKGRAGAYEVYAYDGFLDRGGDLEYKLVVLNARTLTPIYAVHPRVSASDARPGGPLPTTTARITTYGNVFFYDLPNPYPGHWMVHLVLTGRLGRGAVSFRMHGAVPADSSAAATPIVTVQHPFPWAGVGVGAGVVVAALAVAVWFRLRRRRPATR
jgi:hypothetical protein